MKIINNNSNKYIIYNIFLVQEAQLSQRGSATLCVLTICSLSLHFDFPFLECTKL